MELITHFQNMSEVNNNESILGGIFANQSTLDTTIGLRHDTDIGQINSLFDDIKSKKDVVGHTDPDAVMRNKRDDGTSNPTQENNGNSTIWIIVGVIFGVIIILLITFIVLYRMNKRKSLLERTKTMYSNISNKLSSLRGNTKNTMIDEE